MNISIHTPHCHLSVPLLSPPPLSLSLCRPCLAGIFRFSHRMLLLLRNQTEFLAVNQAERQNSKGVGRQKRKGVGGSCTGCGRRNNGRRGRV